MPLIVLLCQFEKSLFFDVAFFVALRSPKVVASVLRREAVNHSSDGQRPSRSQTTKMCMAVSLGQCTR
jgi:hypothetical protein